MEQHEQRAEAVILGIAVGIMRNQADEAGAVGGYSTLLEEMIRARDALSSPDTEELRGTLEEAIDAVEEIISDELNHQELLRRLYSALVGINAAKD